MPKSKFKSKPNWHVLPLAGIVVIIISTFLILSSQKPSYQLATDMPLTYPTIPVPTGSLNLNTLKPGQSFGPLTVVSVAKKSEVNTVTFRGEFLIHGKKISPFCLDHLKPLADKNLPNIISIQNPSLCFTNIKSATSGLAKINTNSEVTIKLDDLAINQGDGHYQATFLTIIK